MNEKMGKWQQQQHVRSSRIFLSGFSVFLSWMAFFSDCFFLFLFKSTRDGTRQMSLSSAFILIFGSKNKNTQSSRRMNGGNTTASNFGPFLLLFVWMRARDSFVSLWKKRPVTAAWKDIIEKYAKLPAFFLKNNSFNRIGKLIGILSRKEQRLEETCHSRSQ